jgi:hypothetical protein
MGSAAGENYAMPVKSRELSSFQVSRYQTANKNTNTNQDKRETRKYETWCLSESLRSVKLCFNIHLSATLCNCKFKWELVCFSILLIPPPYSLNSDYLVYDNTSDITCNTSLTRAQ